MKLIDNAHIYNTQQKILIAVDCIIFGFVANKLKLLLFKRKIEPFRGDWSLIGAFIKNDQSIDDGAKQILFETTGLDNIYLEQLKTYGSVYRDPAERVISVTYYSLTSVTEFELESVEKYDAHWFDLDEIPELIFDHSVMVQDAIESLRQKAKHQPIGFNLLPEFFTIPELQTLYECIYQRPLDTRNFRKKILSFDILNKSDKKDKSGSKKGAFLYSFDKEKFETLIAKGVNFEI
ncbi:ADP-ribose pyrophosphatase YjhB, NUDIX family [Lutibacter oricola]|uniref:ADP-ribose pyrophosphatase YjhB, NUDIX family n=1 Tax=Lutibacter oricola TaxID=762486 RepID=A0A1H2UAV6_9FLAO|nr:NUDIX domain-containing protein [Lutibacter oricola]SDW53311.1 ADP-ribose pyrophosphatase YjhB, NUDIX family [Lutibacter oricola]